MANLIEVVGKIVKIYIAPAGKGVMAKYDGGDVGRGGCPAYRYGLIFDNPANEETIKEALGVNRG